MLTHAGLIGLILLLAANHHRVTGDPPQDEMPTASFKLPKDLARILGGERASQGTGIGGDQNPLPATSGNLPVRSSIQIVRPTLPTNRTSEVPIPPTILDPTAAAVLTPVPDIGLPWMNDPNHSAGPGEGHSIGSGPGHSMGDRDGPDAGDSLTRGPYQPGSSRPSCAYCPDPQYTDSARESKLQGTVTLAVLVGADGRAQRIQLVKGVGMGLDERAMEVVRSWKFVPARDAARTPVAEWVTIEAMFRLF